MIRKHGDVQKIKSAVEPYQRPNDNWVDVVVQADFDSNQVIARRSRSLRWRRGIFTLSVTGFTFGLLLMLFSSDDYRNEILAPGDLCSSHAQILAGQGTDRCAACHPAGDQSFSQWASATFFGRDQNLPTQSQLCMKCHENSLSADFAMNPHGVDPAILQQKTDATVASSYSSLNSVSRLSSPVVEGEIQCSVCHREHHGADNDLTALTDQQCQNCHKNTFHSFEIDHPPFKDFPLSRRSRIAFDHNSHSGKHFAAANESFDCAKCHVDDDFKNVKRMASFEQACASCHSQKIQQSGEAGLALFALPTLDTEAIEEAGLDIGSWPLSATGDFDGALPPLMRLLLSADADALEVLKGKDDQFDFSDLDPGIAKDVQDGVTLVWATKRLLFELARDGRPAIARRIKSFSGIDVDPERLNSLASSLSELAFQNAANRWLPNLQQEVRDQVPIFQASQTMERQLSFLLAEEPQANHRAEEDDLILFRFVAAAKAELSESETPQDSDLLAENPLSVMKAKSLQVERQVPARKKTAKLPRIIAGPRNDRVSIASGSQGESGRKVISNQHVGPTSKIAAGMELLVENPLAGNKLKPTMIIESEAASSPAASVSATPANKVDASPKGQPALVSVAPNTVTSGWLRDDDRFQIRYQPEGHADSTLQAWIELLGEFPDVTTDDQSKPIHDELFSTQGLGNCRSCHTADQQQDGKLLVNWTAKYRNPANPDWTKFSHGPHMSLPNLKDCSACHALNSEANAKDSFVGYDASKCISDFHSITTANCASCHQANSTSNSCTQCHNYHVGQHGVR